MKSFDEYKDTDDFLQLTQTNLKSVLASDDIEMKELDVFHSAIRWAEFHCEEMNVEPSEERIREVLGDCLFEIRFPIISNKEFTEAVESRNILTAEESLAIYRFIGLAASKKLEFDATKIPFKTIQRKESILTPPSISTLCLPRDSKIVENPPFVCDGSAQYHCLVCEKKIKIYGLGFLGPIENDGFYDVEVHIYRCDEIGFDSGMMESKHIFSQKGKPFYFFFDTPVEIEAGSVDEWSNVYLIEFNLKGPNTFAFNRSMYTDSLLQKRDTLFCLEWHSNQLAEVLFK